MLQAACDAGVNDTRDRTNNDGGAGLRGRPISRSPFHRCARHAAGSDETSTYGKTAGTCPPSRRSGSNDHRSRYLNRVAISLAIAFVAAFVGASSASAFSKPKSWIVPS